MTHPVFNYPYEDLRLEDLPGEKWKDLPDYEGYYQISNKGRVKALPRSYERLMGKNGYIKYETPTQIRRQTCKKCKNKYTGEYTYSLSFPISIDKIKTTLVPSRLVYELFVGKIEKDLVVLHKDNEGRNNLPENLYVATRQELAKRIIQENRRDANSFKNYIWTAERIKARLDRSNIRTEISQYDKEGNYLATYESIREAERQTGINNACISECINGLRSTAKKYIWQKGHYPHKLKIEKTGRQGRVLIITRDENAI